MSTSVEFEYKEELKFEWDENKNQANQKKHGVSFEEAASVFDDLFHIIVPDTTHSFVEERFAIIGFSEEERLLTVCHC